MDNEIARAFIEKSRAALDQERRRIAHCLGQLTDEDVWWRPRPKVNCIGNVLLHLFGNLRQWFLHGFGGEEDIRNRPAEFAAVDAIPKADLLAELEDLFQHIDAILDGVDYETLLANKRIQGYDTDGLGAIYGTINHLEGHGVQMAYITHLRLGDLYEPFWKPASKEQGA